MSEPAAVETVALEPVRADERIQLIDILRGFALFGILLVNFEGKVGTAMPAFDGAVDRGLELLVKDSLYPLFCFLFGLGFAIQVIRATERGASVLHVYLRRLFVLFLIGTVHAVLIWDGDVLTVYAIAGLLLIPVQNLPTRGVLLVLLLLTAFQFEQRPLQRTLEEWRSTPERQVSAELAEGVRAEQVTVAGNLGLRVGNDGSWLESVAARWKQYGQRMKNSTEPFQLLGNDVLLLFLLGMYVGRRRLFHDVHKRRGGFTIVAVISVAAAVAGNILQARFPDATPELELASWMAANLGVTAFYIAAIALIVSYGGRLGRAFSVLAPVGRMGLTNYLMQSIAMTLLFAPYGIGLTEPPVVVHALVNVVFFFLIQVPLSHWWLARFRYGPAEWLWRSLTYGHAQPMQPHKAVYVAAPEPVPA